MEQLCRISGNSLCPNLSVPSRGEGGWKVSESASIRIGKCQNRQVSESESVRIGKCPNRQVSEPERVRIGKCHNWKVLE